MKNLNITKNTIIIFEYLTILIYGEKLAIKEVFKRLISMLVILIIITWLMIEESGACMVGDEYESQDNTGHLVNNTVRRRGIVNTSSSTIINNNTNNNNLNNSSSSTILNNNNNKLNNNNNLNTSSSSTILNNNNNKLNNNNNLNTSSSSTIINNNNNKLNNNNNLNTSSSSTIINNNTNINNNENTNNNVNTSTSIGNNKRSILKEKIGKFLDNAEENTTSSTTVNTSSIYSFKPATSSAGGVGDDTLGVRGKSGRVLTLSEEKAKDDENRFNYGPPYYDRADDREDDRSALEIKVVRNEVMDKLRASMVGNFGESQVRDIENSKLDTITLHKNLANSIKAAEKFEEDGLRGVMKAEIDGLKNSVAKGIFAGFREGLNNISRVCGVGVAYVAVGIMGLIVVGVLLHGLGLVGVPFLKGGIINIIKGIFKKTSSVDKLANATASVGEKVAAAIVEVGTAVSKANKNGTLFSEQVSTSLTAGVGAGGSSKVLSYMLKAGPGRGALMFIGPLVFGIFEIYFKKK